jgi:putative ABC transport system substrate-binding protein
MKKYLLLVVLACLVFIPSLSYSQQVAVVVSKRLQLYMDALDGFREGSRQSVGVYILEGDSAADNSTVQRLNNSSPRVVGVIGSYAASLVRPYANRFPIIYCMILNPEGQGLAGSNITGVYLDIPVQGVFSEIRNISGTNSRVGILYNPNRYRGLAGQATREGDRLGLEVTLLPVASATEVSIALKNARGNINVIYLPLDETLMAKEIFDYISQFCIENKIMLTVTTEKFVKQGAALAVTADFKGVGRQAGEMANRILTGGSSSQPAPEYPRYVTLIINKKIMDLIGFNVPDNVMSNAVVIR